MKRKRIYEGHIHKARPHRMCLVGVALCVCMMGVALWACLVGAVLGNSGCGCRLVGACVPVCGLELAVSCAVHLIQILLVNMNSHAFKAIPTRLATCFSGATYPIVFQNALEKEKVRSRKSVQ